MMMQNSKKLALGYLAQAQSLLPRIGIDDHPGDGGPDDGKLTREEVAELYARIIDVQVMQGQKPAARATFERAKKLILVGKETHHGVLETALKSAVKHFSHKEAVALYEKYATDAYLLVRLAPALSNAEIAPLVREAIEMTARQKDLSLWQQGDQYVQIARVVGRAEQKSVFAALAALAPKLLEQGFAGPLALCEASSLGMEIDRTAVEKALREGGDEAPGYVALGLLWLGKKPDAMAALARLTDKSHVNAFPDSLVEPLGLADFMALVKRVKTPTVVARAALTANVAREDDVRLKLLQFADALEPGFVDARDWRRLAELVPGDPEHSVALRRIRSTLRRELPEREKYWKQRPVSGPGERSAREAEWEEIVEQSAEADPLLAARYLARVTEPRRKVGALLALAYAEAERSLPKSKGDLG